MSPVLHILFVLLGVVLPVVLLLNARRGRGGRRLSFTPTFKVRLYYGNGAVLLILAGLVLAAWGVVGRPLTALGLGWGRTPYDPVAIGVMFAFLLLYGIDLYVEAGNAERQEDTRRRFRTLGFLPTNGVQYLHFLFLCGAAGVGEEIVYRGFMVTYLNELLGPGGWATLATLLVPAVAFGVAHFYQGARAVVKIIAMALLFGFFFYRTGSLWPLILLHTAIDAVGGLLNWYLERNERQSV